MDSEYSLQDVVRCHVCETPVPTLHCNVCDVHLCKDCQEKHISDKSTEHVLVTFELRGRTIKYNKRQKCNCEPCAIKRHQLKSHRKWRRIKKIYMIAMLVMAWMIYAFLVNKVSKTQRYEPYGVHQLNKVFVKGVTKDQMEWEELQLTDSFGYHLDEFIRDIQKLLQIDKAYTSLTDKELQNIFKLVESEDREGHGVSLKITLQNWILEKHKTMRGIMGWYIGENNIMLSLNYHLDQLTEEIETLTVEEIQKISVESEDPDGHEVSSFRITLQNWILEKHNPMRGVTKDQVGQNYLKLSLKYHLDKFTEDIEKFIQVGKAYKTLTDKEIQKISVESEDPDCHRVSLLRNALQNLILEKHKPMRGITKDQIGQNYIKLSLKYHLDKFIEDIEKFIQIGKAYTTLTNKEIQKISVESEDPVGPGVLLVGKTLPNRIPEKHNAMRAALLLMALLPVAVVVWWFCSIKSPKDKVTLIDTTRLYYYSFQKDPYMIIEQVIVVLAGSFEFDKFYNAEIVDRLSDHEEVTMLMNHLSNVDEIYQKKLLCYPYSDKTRALLHAYFQRLEVPPATLAIDQAYIVKKCPYLINEMINVIEELIARAYQNEMALQCMPRLETIENCMKVSQMLIQAVDVRTSPLLQLPHLTQDLLKHFTTKEIHITNIRDLIGMKEEDRCSLLSFLTANQYQDIMHVCASLPFVKMKVSCQVLDDEDTSITAGSIVTVYVNLKRQMMGVMFDKEMQSQEDEDQDIMIIADQDNGFNLYQVLHQKEANESHPVHCPFYGEEKQEGWWLYVSDKSTYSLITTPVQILTLKDEEEISLTFSTPKEPGSYTYTVCLRSDCYVDFDQSKNILLDVKEAKVIEDYPQWDIPDDEDDKDKDEGTCSDYSTESDEPIGTD